LCDAAEWIHFLNDALEHGMESEAMDVAIVVSSRLDMTGGTLAAMERHAFWSPSNCQRICMSCAGAAAKSALSVASFRFMWTKAARELIELRRPDADVALGRICKSCFPVVSYSVTPIAALHIRLARDVCLFLVAWCEGRRRMSVPLEVLGFKDAALTAAYLRSARCKTALSVLDKHAGAFDVDADVFKHVLDVCGGVDRDAWVELYCTEDLGLFRSLFPDMFSHIPPHMHACTGEQRRGLALDWDRWRRYGFHVFGFEREWAPPRDCPVLRLSHIAFFSWIYSHHAFSLPAIVPSPDLLTEV
jgi:hypothetical protein